MIKSIKQGDIMKVYKILKVPENGDEEMVLLLESEKFGRTECVFASTVLLDKYKDDIIVYKSVNEALDTLADAVDNGVLKKFTILEVLDKNSRE